MREDLLFLGIAELFLSHLHSELLVADAKRIYERISDQAFPLREDTVAPCGGENDVFLRLQIMEKMCDVFFRFYIFYAIADLTDEREIPFLLLPFIICRVPFTSFGRNRK